MTALNSYLPPLSLYIHIPWCIRKCPYCDFNSHEVKGHTPEVEYIDALLTDLRSDLHFFDINRPIHSIFIGGGTPSLFAPEAFHRLLSGIKKQVALEDACEITLEANPGTFESQKFAEFRALGINRLSIGIQSFDDALLERLGRVHNAKEAIRAAEIAQDAGFDNFNLDLMFGLPDAHDKSSRDDIATAIALNPSHISLYQLTIEPNTYFYKFPPILPDDESIFISQLECQHLLASHGYLQYEISAYGKLDRQCQHNLNYWQFGDYLGIGAGAHAKISTHLPQQIVRSSKPKNPEQYAQNPGGNRQVTLIDQTELPLEFLMNQLRLKPGFTLAHYQKRTGLGSGTLEPALSHCLQQGLLIRSEDSYQCTKQGWHFLDSVLEKFVP